ncbi:alpha-N-arabinofuranosidase [Mucilaginibacter arboris]|uniref:non-reducing end alpha-L-arabinofuranosidase n=1 Tax=Mucilaginibacter arboris TaxID=2682090 RepID=A0A7K1SZ24_9SPHI|nr:alpha-L-arabinofuranosidase C-terminal domain-containing protein [Mucilaginibacter arboris]MVN22561.1 alpha-N-arabinofuranosidase [Mucilaginibacter arboris]
MKQLTVLSLFFLVFTQAFSQQTAQATVNGKDAKTQISRQIYGQFAEHLGRSIYDGFWVPEGSNIPNKGRIRMDIVEALKKIHVPNLRWPGGCFADEYHWRDGIGPRPQRPKMVNTNWGGVTEDNSFGTHEFLELCGMIGCEPYVSANVGSGTVEEMSKWVEYLNFDGISPMATLRAQNGHPAPYKVSFWGVGNESWGCGGTMTPDFYSDQYRRYATYARDYPGTKLKKIASGASDFDYNWTEVAMKKIGTRMWGLSLHYYTLPTGNWSKKGSATNFNEIEYAKTMRNCLKMEELVTKHSAIMDKYDPEKKVALVVDEWGIWTDVEPGTNPGFLFQQNSMRDALIAGSTLNIFQNHAERVKMANLAQAVNVLQSLVLTQKDKMILTPTYHVFDLYQVHQDATLLPITIKSPDYTVDDVTIPSVNASASRDSSGVVHISFVNLNATKKITVSTVLQDVNYKTVQGRILTSSKFNDYNSFDQPNKIKPTVFTSAKKQGNQLVAELPPLSVVVLTLRK